MTRRFISAVLLFTMLILTVSCGAAPDHPFMDDIPEIIPVVPAEETFVFQCDEYDIAVNVETMLPYHFFGYSEGFFQVCYDAGNHTDHGYSCQNVGFIDTYGNVVVPLENRLGEPYCGGFVVLQDIEMKYRFVDSNGETAFQTVFDYATPFNEYGLAIVYVNDSDKDLYEYGVINNKGEYVIPPQPYTLDFLTNDLLLVSDYNNGAYIRGVMNMQGDIIIPMEFKSIDLRVSEGLIQVEASGISDYSTVNSRFGYYDTQGNVVILPELDYWYSYGFYDGMALVLTWTGEYVFDTFMNYEQQVAQYGYINKSGKLAIPMEYNFANSFIDGLAMVGRYKSVDGEKHTMVYGFIDTEGNAVAPVEYAAAREFSEGLAAVGVETENGVKFGYVNRSGEVVIPPAYEVADLFCNGYAWVRHMDMWGMIDNAGDMIIPLTYQNYKIVSDKLIAVKSENLWGLLNFAGQVIVPSFYDSIDIFSYGLAVAEKDGKFGVINTNGDIIVPFEYDEIQRFDDFIIVRADGLRGVWRIILH